MCKTGNTSVNMILYTLSQYIQRQFEDATAAILEVIRSDKEEFDIDIEELQN